MTIARVRTASPDAHLRCAWRLASHHCRMLGTIAQVCAYHYHAMRGEFPLGTIEEFRDWRARVLADYPATQWSQPEDVIWARLQGKETG